MSTHTPGPWKVVENKSERTVQIDTERGTVVNPGGISWVPNARLIAAAPRMLAILTALDEYGYHATDPNEIKDAVNEARAILRDVEGQS